MQQNFAQRGTGNPQRQQLPGTLMPPRTKRKTAPLRAIQNECVGTLIELGVSIGRSQQHQNHIAGIETYTLDFARCGDKPAGVLHRRVEALNFGDQVVNGCRVA